MKIDLSLKEIKYLKDVMLFQRLIDPKAKEIALDIVVKLSTILDATEVKLTSEEKKIAEKAAKLIARDYGETLHKLTEDEEDAKYRRKIVK